MLMDYVAVSIDTCAAKHLPLHLLKRMVSEQTFILHMLGEVSRSMQSSMDVSIFKECQPEFLHDLVLKMKAYIFTPGDLICRKGEVAREMFIIADGILEVISDMGKVLTTMKAGDFFGEIGILNLDGLNKRTADVRSVGYSELFSLSREDVLMAMKDYPEAQEILQSLGHKRLKEARHTSTAKVGSASSSKRGSLSPNRESSGEERQPKKFVSRLRSDVSAIRNAFRRTKGMTRDLETMELEPLTPEDQGSLEDEAPTVRKLLRKLGREGGSGGSEKSGGTSRGVLKRMSHVTADEPQQIKGQGDDCGILGAGLPLLQRLKLLKEKEEREEKQKFFEVDGTKKGKLFRDLTVMQQEPSENGDKKHEVIGAGLPLFARLKLLKAKEEREKAEENERSEHYVNERGNLMNTGLVSSTKKETESGVDYKDKSLLNDQIVATELPQKNDNIRDVDKIAAAQCLKESISRSSSADELINDLNKGTEENSECEDQDLKSSNSIKSFKENKSMDSPELESNITSTKNLNISGTKSSTIAVSLNGSPIVRKNGPEVDASGMEKLQRRDSFKRAMGEGLIKGSDEKQFNIHTSESNCSIDDNKVDPVIYENREQPYEQNFQIKNGQQLLSSVNTRNFEEVHENQLGSKAAYNSVKKPESSPDDNNSKETATLKVLYSEVSPPFSSPESTETPERKTLKSILKRISREDSRYNLLPSGGADLRRLMQAQTVQGFVARRSKFSKSVSFQHKTLSTSPIQQIINAASRQSTQPSPVVISSSEPRSSDPLDSQPRTDGIQKLANKLAPIGTEPSQPSQTEELFRGVRKILREKIEDVELAWETKIEILQEELAEKELAIKQLTEKITNLEAKSTDNGITDFIVEKKEGSESKEIRLEDSLVQRKRLTPPLRAQLSETSNPSSDEDEPLFMRCNSIESIIHQSPIGSADNINRLSQETRRWSRPQMQRQMSIEQNRFLGRSWDSDEDSERKTASHEKKMDVIIDVGESSTDDDIYSFSSDDDHVIFGSIPEDDTECREETDLPDDEFEEEDDNANENERVDETDEQELSSQDWEVQMLARQLAQEQRGVARIIDRDIASGKLHSPLAELHEALATDNLSNLTELDLLRLEKIVRREREKLRQYARMYSLDERPVLEDEFSSLYRSRSQLLVSKSSELCQAGPTERRLSTLLKQLTTLPPPEQFLLDRLVYKKARTNKKFNRQHSLCDERLSSHDESRSLLLLNRSSATMRRSLSMCSPPPTRSSLIARYSNNIDSDDPSSEEVNIGLKQLPKRKETEHGRHTVSALLASRQRSIGSLLNRGGIQQGTSLKGSQQLCRPPR